MTNGVFRLTRGEGHVGAYIGSLYFGVCFTLYWTQHLRNAFFRWDRVGGTTLLRIGPLTWTHWIPHAPIRQRYYPQLGDRD